LAFGFASGQYGNHHVIIGKYIITALPFRLDVILVIMSVSTFKTAVILYVSENCAFQEKFGDDFII